MHVITGHEAIPLAKSVISEDGHLTLGLDPGAFPLHASCSVCGQSVGCDHFAGEWRHLPLPAPRGETVD